MSTSKNDLPILITPGDIAGIGPEVALKALVNNNFDCKFKLVGPEWLWKQTSEKFSVPINADFINVPSLSNIPERKIKYGEVSTPFGTIAMECLRFAATECLEQKAVGIVTAPFPKAGIHLDGYH